MRLSALFVICSMLLLPATTANACGGAQLCDVGERSYAAAPPAGWDGRSPLPVLLHFHGWGRQGKNVLRNERVSGATRDNGVLLLAPNGLGKSWSFWGNNRRDIEFAEAVIEDAARRWPIDRSRIFVSGFSFGSSMAWALACDSGDRYAGFLAIAGGLRNLDQRRCRTGPVTLRHVHGLEDTVMSLPAGAHRAPSATLQNWRAISRCAGAPRVKARGNLTSHSWENCSNGRQVQIHLHPGGHWIPKGWVSTQLKELLAR